MLSERLLRRERRSHLPIRRPEGIVGAVLLFCLYGIVITANQAPQSVASLPELQIGRVIEGQISGAQRISYRISADAGDFIWVVVEPRGIPVVSTLWRPDSTIQVDVIYAHDDFQPQMIVAIADVAGSYRVDVRADQPASPARPYQIRLEARRPPTPDDLIRIEAERAYERGRRLEGAGVITQYPKAIDEFKSAQALDARVGDRAGVLRALIGQGRAELYLIRPETLETADAAERLATELQDEATRAEAIHLRGSFLDRTGDMAGGLRDYEDALRVYSTLGRERNVLLALNDTASIYGRSGDADRALSQLQHAVAIADELHDAKLRQFLLNNLGIAYKNVGEYDKALAAYEETLAAQLVNRNIRATVLNNAGNVQRLLGHYPEALALHRQALDISRETGNKEVEARSLNTIGQTYFALGDYAAALRSEQESLGIRRALGDLSAEASSLDPMGRALQKLGDLDGAYARLTEALTIRRNIRERGTEPTTLESLAVVERERGDLPQAIEHIKAAVDLDEDVREGLTSPELRATFVAAEMDKYSLFIDLLQQQDAAEPGRGHAAEALQVSERARARVLLESLLDARVDLRHGIDPGLLDRERSLQRQLNLASSQISRALASGKEPAADLVRTYEHLTSDYQTHRALIRQQSPQYAAMTQPQPLDAAEIQHSVIDNDTVLLEFELGKDKSWLWAMTPTTLTSVALPARGEIDAAARALYENLTARQRGSGETTAAYAKRVAAADAMRDASASTMSRVLFSGIARQLQTEWRSKRLAIVADGSLEYVPFAALPMPGSRTLLTSRHEIVKIPSASVLAVLRSESSRRAPAAHALAIVADPVFEASDPRVAAGVAQPLVSLAASSQNTIGLPGDFEESLYVRSGLSRLPFSRDEANAIAALVDAKDVLKAVDFDATRATALGSKLAGYRIVHLATHGVLDSARPSLSGLVFSLVDERGQHQDGFVRLHDIYNMKLDADLVVLSACQTALGKDIKGEGLIGLTRAFMYAGTPRVVASLWEVSDLATAELMKKFYAAMLQRHLPPAAALRAAQLEMSRDPRWSAPYYWAGFVFQGDWR